MSDEQYAELRDLIVYLCAKTTELEARVLDIWTITAAATPLHAADPDTASKVLRACRDDLIDARMKFLAEQFPHFAKLFREFADFSDADQSELAARLRAAALRLKAQGDSPSPPNKT